MSENAGILAIATLLSTGLSKKYNLDNVMYGALYSVNTMIITGISNFDTNKININMSYIYSCCIIILLLSAIIFKKRLVLYINQLSFTKYHKLVIKSEYGMKTFVKYVKKYKHMFDLPESFVFNDYDDEIQLNKAEENYIVRFNDENLKITGYYIVGTNDILKKSIIDGKEQVSVEKQNAINVFLKCANGIDIMNYIYEIEKYVLDTVEIEDNSVRNIRLCAVKTFDYKDGEIKKYHNEVLTIYYGPELNSTRTKELYIDTFFHPQKEHIWKVIKNVDNPSNIYDLQIGHIFYGPAGTGKSRFAYCIAMALKRHLVSIDLLSVSRLQLYQIIKRPNVDGQTLSPNKVVFNFDEFDQVICALYEREVLKKKDKERDKIAFEMYEKNMEHYIKHRDDTDEDGKLLHKLPTQPISSFSKYTLDTNNDVTVGCLLEILQGPVPLRGAIITAQTNNFEKIRQICPELFRDGRLTPIYFGYARNETLQEISMHYYKKELEFTEDIIATVCTASIINFISAGSDFEEFANYISKNIKSYEPSSKL